MSLCSGSVVCDYTVIPVIQKKLQMTRRKYNDKVININILSHGDLFIQINLNIFLNQLIMSDLFQNSLQTGISKNVLEILIVIFSPSSDILC